MLFSQDSLFSDTKLVFVRASVTFSGKTVYTNSLWLSVVSFHFQFPTVVKAWLCVNSYKALRFTVDKQHKRIENLPLNQPSKRQLKPSAIDYPQSALLSGTPFNLGTSLWHRQCVF